MIAADNYNSLIVNITELSGAKE